MALPRLLFESRFADAAPVASTEAAGFPVADLTDWRDYTAWQPTALPADVTVDCGSVKAADYALFWGHDLFTQGATVEVRRSTDAFAANNVLVVSKTPTDDAPFVIYFPSESFQHWRLTVTGAGAAPTIAIAAIGARLELPKGLQTGFDPIGRTPKGQFNRSVGGNALGRTVDYEEWSESLTVPNVTWTWAHATWVPAWTAHLRSTPFAIDWHPEDATYGGELRLVAAKAGFTAPHKPGSIADLSFDVMGTL